MTALARILAAASGIAPELVAAGLDVYPELADAVEQLRNADDLSGTEKAQLIAGEIEDVVDAVDNHVPGWRDQLTEAQRDAFNARAKAAALGVVEAIYQGKRATDILVEAGVVKGGLVARIRARRKARRGQASQR